MFVICCFNTEGLLFLRYIILSYLTVVRTLNMRSAPLTTLNIQQRTITYGTMCRSV